MSCEINPLESIDHYHIKVVQYQEGKYGNQSLLLDDEGNEAIAASLDEIYKLMLKDVEFYIASCSKLGIPSIKQVCKTSCIVEWHDQDEKIIQGCEWKIVSH